VPATTTALTLGAAYSLPGYVGWALPTAALRHREPFARVAAYQAILLVAAYEIVRHPLAGRFGNDLSRAVTIVGPFVVLALLARLVLVAGKRARGDDVKPAPPRGGMPVGSAPISSVLVVMPTLNERDNVERLLAGIRSAVGAADVLVVDDASPDGTADLAESLGCSLGSINVLRREGEPGLGSAYRDGFRYGLVHGYDAIVEMDADLSHDPATIPALVDALSRGADLAIGARYISGGATPGWPLHRRLLSRVGGEFARVLLDLPSHDPTSGFRAFRAEVLEECELSTVGAQGFAFQLEMLHRANQLGARVVDVPIVFRDRTAGESKLSGAIAQEALRLVTTLRRRPWQPATNGLIST
jgi:dolichol-phosphate mannosyltransferase